MDFIVSEMTVHTQSKTLEVEFSTGERFCFPFEYLRVFSPSAEVRGHGGSGGTLVLNKQNVNIVAIEPVGNYGIKPTFDDGHNSGIFSWSTLHDLGLNQEKNWQEYLSKISE